MKNKNVKIGMLIEFKHADGHWCLARVATLPKSFGDMDGGKWSFCKTVPERYTFWYRPKNFRVASSADRAFPS